MRKNLEQVNHSEKQQEIKEKEREINIVIIDNEIEGSIMFAKNLELCARDYTFKAKTRVFNQYSAEVEEYISAQLPEIVILDLALGGRYSGDQISQILRTKGYNGQIFFLTGAPMDIHLVTKWQGDDYLEKGFEDPDEMAQKIFSSLK